MDDLNEKNMKIADILSPDHIACAATPASKKKALEEMSEIFAGHDLLISPGDVFDSLLSRERLGSTGIGNGAAIPHGRVANAEHTVGAFMQLQEGIDFDAIDGQPVNLLFGLLVPEESTDNHLQILAMLAEMFKNENFCKKLQDATSAEQLYSLLIEWQPSAE